MSVLEITIQRKAIGDTTAGSAAWPAVFVLSQEGDLPVRSEGALSLDLESLKPLDDPKDYGATLGKALFHDELRDAFIRGISLARGRDESVRVLLTVEAEELRPLHWERLCAPLDETWDFLLLNQSTPFSLYLPSFTDRRFPPIGRRDLRALVLIASPADLKKTYHLDPFDVGKTAAAIKGALGSIPCDLLATIEGAAGPPTLESLLQRLTAEPYTLLHLVCHGKVGEIEGQTETLLYLPDEQGSPITGSVLIERLARLKGARGLPHLAFLMTCESASPEAESGFGGLGQRLVRKLGMPAVLAMTDRVTIRTASELASEFYTRLGVHGEPDRALSEALAGLMERKDVTVPALFSRLGGRPLFSEALDRPLTGKEIEYGLERLSALVDERAPVLKDEAKGLADRLHSLASLEVAALTPEAQAERKAALDAANRLSGEILEMSFAALAQGRPVPSYDNRCPFPGLAPFRADEREFFFGRETLVEKLVNRLKEHPFLAVLGPSGSGKSSLVLAGLVPALERSGKGAPHAYLTPGRKPLSQLDTALEAAPGSSLVVVDQFEEIFTLCKNEAEREAFIRRLLGLEQRVVLTMRADFWGECAPYTKLREAVQAHQELVAPLDAVELRRAIEQQAAAVGLRFEAGLAETILDDVQGEPGAMPLLQHALFLLWERRHGRWLRFAEYQAFGGVSKAIANTADEIFLSLSDNEQKRVREIFIRLTQLDEAPAAGSERRDTRRRVDLAKLVPDGSDAAATQELVHQLAGARLLATGGTSLEGQEEVEVAHEALIRSWPRLADWLDKDRAALRLGDGVREAAEEWSEATKDESLLVHRGKRLDDALAISAERRYPFNQDERVYLSACQALRDRERQAKERLQKRIIFASIAAAILMALLGAFGWYQAGEANRQAATATYALGESQLRGTQAAEQAAIAGTQAAIADTERNRAQQQARISLARQLAAQAKELLANQPQHLERAVLLSIESLKMNEESSASEALAQSLLILPRQVSGMTHDDLVTGVAFSPDSQRVASASWDGTARVWDASSGDEIARFTHPGAVYSLAFSPGDGNRLVTASADGTARVWDVEARTEIAEMVHNGLVWSVAFSPVDGKLVVSGSADGAVIVWEAGSGNEIARMIHDNAVNAVAFSPDERWVVSGSDDGSARVWDVATGNEIARMDQDHPVNAVAFSPFGEFVVSGSEDNTARVWVAASGEEVARMTHNAFVKVVAFSPDGQRVVSGSGDGTARVWEAATGNEISRMAQGRVDSVAFSPYGEWVVSGGWDGTARIWAATSGQEIARMGHDEPVYAVAYSPDGRWVVTSGYDNGKAAVGVWEVIRDGGAASMEVMDRSTSPDGKWIVYGSDDHDVIVEDTATGQEVARMFHDDYAPVAAFSPDGKWLVSGSLDATARVWDIASRGEIARMTHDAPVWSVAFSPDGKWVVSGSYDQTVRVWEAATGREISRVIHDQYVNAVAFSPDGKLVVSGSADKTARVWEAATGREISRLTPGDSVESVDFSLDGQWVISRSLSGNVYVWSWNPQDQMELACERLTRNLTQEEWRQYLGDEPYQQTCPNLPPGE